MHATYVLNREIGEFVSLQFTGDRWHVRSHTCVGVYTPAEYTKYLGMNTSLIEQWHSIMDCLTDIAAGSTLRHAMFMLQLLHDDRYMEICKDKALKAASW